MGLSFGNDKCTEELVTTNMCNKSEKRVLKSYTHLVEDSIYAFDGLSNGEPLMARDAQHLMTYFHVLFNEPFNMQTFDNRLLFQKRTYLLQELFGIPLGYMFGWYIRGPYSSELTRDGFENESMSRLFHEKWDEMSKQLPPVEREDETTLERAQGLFESVRESGIDEGRFLELLSSLHFMQVNWYSQETCTKVGDELRKLKPRFTQEETEVACRLIQELI